MPVQRYVRVVVPTPLRRHFDYLPPVSGPLPPPGARVRVPFGRRQLIGVVVDNVEQSDYPRDQLKPIQAVLDSESILTPEIDGLVAWAADYYQYPLGEAVATALPVLLRQGEPAVRAGVEFYRLSAAGWAADLAALMRAPRQRHVFGALAAAGDNGLPASALDAALGDGWRAAFRALLERGWVKTHIESPAGTAASHPAAGPELSAAQVSAVAAINATAGFQCLLLHGVTGSGKTEVYLQLIAQVLARGQRVLLLTPEIGLTPQLVARVRERFGDSVALLHSGLGDRERLDAWLAARSGAAGIVLGTRSAVYTPIPDLGLIVVDEEHDTSYKQQDGFRYHARDVAILRASRARVPVVLGSATPSLESLYNADTGRYRLLELPDRTGSARLPAMGLLDMRSLKAHDGLTRPLREAIAQRLERGEQSLLFLNRRGFAPVLMCHGCGWLAPCARCDARLTVHRGRARLICHHCGAEQALPARCPVCGGDALHGLGEGTERVEQALAGYFPYARIERIDRDSTRRKGALEAKLARIAAGQADILIGTQMLSKGHDFPNVTLVGVINADQGLYSTDFRAAELMFQQIAQVAGRAGRADKPGQVLIQTWHPEHMLFQALQRHDYRGYADGALRERREAGFPPFSHLALLRAEATHAQAPLAFLRRARQLALSLSDASVEVMDAIPSAMERRAGRYRAQLLLRAAGRAALHALLRAWVPALEQEPLARKVRWSLDVDPVDLY